MAKCLGRSPSCLGFITGGAGIFTTFTNRNFLRDNIPRRTLRTTSQSQVQHLLWSGTLLDRSSSCFTPFDADLFKAAGASQDFDHGISLLPPSSSPTRGHSLLPYTTKEGLSKIFAIGRNTFSQLGLGFSSHEATFGLIRPGFSGQGGIDSVHTGPTQSFILTRDARGATTALFACGNNTLGQLGLGDASTSQGGESQLHLFPAPRQISLPRPSTDTSQALSVEEPTISSFAVGIDHAILCLRDGSGTSSCHSTGMNGDGQLGNQADKLGHSRTFQEIDLSSRVEDDLRLVAGGDTSVAWTPSSVYVWGNSEYGQSLVQQNQVLFPEDITKQVRIVIGDLAIKDIQLTGTAMLILDVSGRLFSSGFGPTGRRRDSSLQRVEDIPPIDSLSVSLDSVIAISQCHRRIFVWGLDTNGGTLGLGSWASGKNEQGHHHLAEQKEWQQEDVVRRVHLPKELNIKRWLGESGKVEWAVCGGEVSYLVIEDGQEPRCIWQSHRGLVRES